MKRDLRSSTRVGAYLDNLNLQIQGLNKYCSPSVSPIIGKHSIGPTNGRNDSKYSKRYIGLGQEALRVVDAERFACLQLYTRRGKQWAALLVPEDALGHWSSWGQGAFGRAAAGRAKTATITKTQRALVKDPDDLIVGRNGSFKKLHSGQFYLDKNHAWMIPGGGRDLVLSISLPWALLLSPASCVRDLYGQEFGLAELGDWVLGDTLVRKCPHGILIGSHDLMAMLVSGGIRSANQRNEWEADHYLIKSADYSVLIRDCAKELNGFHDVAAIPGAKCFCELYGASLLSHRSLIEILMDARLSFVEPIPLSARKAIERSQDLLKYVEDSLQSNAREQPRQVALRQMWAVVGAVRLFRAHRISAITVCICRFSPAAREVMEELEPELTQIEVWCPNDGRRSSP